MLKVQEIREIIKLIDQSSISEFTYETNGTSVSLKKGGNQGKFQKATTEIEVEQLVKQEEKKPVQTHPEKTQSDAKLNNEEKTSSVNYDFEIVSPMVGTFYTASSPEKGPFVFVGSSVEADTVVCIVEAMKLFNEIEAETSGEIVEIMVENGELVEYGQPLFRVKKK
ncbi:acetyl-CoA carboxylase biotin carboxyl carrier protein [Oceanobacillus rekensis]|uniref:acetyl-CoA carboxylase biotin carboxyl carrier protein n=1 Tax=Oceanobacillus rekensis TaxID=937927 RepID=UPI000B43254D|nr:acetyl-CoA carboxylase biotin carboxyl carrier protein [Oceanobacillus rekensis]